MKYESTLKKNLGGKISSHAMKKHKDAKSNALKSAIEGKRKAIRKHHEEKELSGVELFRK